MIRWYLVALTALVACAMPEVAAAALFNRVVTLGDSLMDDPAGTRSPLASEQVADRLGAPLVQLAKSGSTSDSLLADGQHSTAAANFGPGDLALLWIGGNDFFYASIGIGFGGQGIVDDLAANVDEILGTLRSAGMDVVVFNLPDMAQVPLIQTTVAAVTPFNILRQAILNNFTASSAAWGARLDQLAAQHGATVVDVFSLFNQRLADPQAFAILDRPVSLGPQFGGQFAVFADNIHPSAYIQGVIANEALAAISAAYDPQGATPLAPLSVPELAPLVNLLAGDFSGGGTVDGADLTIWKSGFGRGPGVAAGSHATGDANDDNRVDGSDFLVWQRELGRSIAAAAATTAVPEPDLLLLIAAAPVVARIYNRGPSKRAKLSAARRPAGRARWVSKSISSD